MSRSFIAMFCTLLLPLLSHADDTTNTDMLQSLQEDMQEYSEIATRTRQNVDYMPYVVSAWNSDELTKMGISTLGEALTLVPGVDTSIGTVGTVVPIFRGSNPFAMGQSLLVLDGVVLNDKMTGGYDHVMEMPVNLIQRIEVVRGPGSLLGHINSYAGSIHVITKSNRDDGLAVKNEVFAELGSTQYRSAGFIASHRVEELSVNGDFFYKQHDQVLPVSLDRFDNSGESQQRLKNYSAGINANYKNISFKTRFINKEKGASYGQSFSLSEDDSDFISVDNNFAELAMTHEISNEIKVDLSLGYIELNRRLQNKVIPDNGLAPSPGGPVVLVNGRYFLVDLVEETFYERAELKISSIESHSIKMGVYAYQSDMAKREGQTSEDDLQTFTTIELLKNTPRDMVSIYIDDLIDLTEKTSIQLGLKHDHYSDVVDQNSPRIALVHRYDDENIFKLMYTSSYREPAWREQYLNTKPFFTSTLDLSPEHVDAYELAYIRRMGLNSHFEANLFYLNNKDQIHAQNPSHTFLNNGDNDLYGIELEFKHVFPSNDQFYFNYSYVGGENVGNELAGSAKNLIKSYYIYNVSDALSLSAIARYVGEKARIKDDLRNEVSSYSLFDVSANYRLKSQSIDLNVSVKNILDEVYFLPSPENTYPNDFERQGRSILFSVKKGF